MMPNLNKIKTKSIQTIIIDSNDFPSIENNIERIHQILNENGSLFIIAENKFKNGVLKPLTLEIADIVKSRNFFLRNSIVWFLPENKPSLNALFVNRYKMIFHFTKNDDSYFFNKDPIRERHIWEKVEWGQRKKNYNPRGKDPGDVWLMTEDDGKANITKHLPLSKEDIILRFILLTTQKKDNVIMLLDDKNCKKICEENARTVIA